MTPVRVGLALLVALVLASPSVSAASARGELEAGAAELSTASIDSAGLDVLVIGADVPVIDFQVSDVAIQRLGASQVRGNVPGGIAYEHTRIDDRASFASARITLTAPGPENIVALRTLGPSMAALESATVRGVGGAMLGVANPVEVSGSPESSPACDNDLYCLDVFGVYELAGDAAAQLSGEMTLLLYGPTLHVVSDGGETRDFASGVDDEQDAGGLASVTDDAWVVVRAKGVTGSVSAPAARLFSAAPTIRASSITFQDADGGVRVGALDYRATDDDVTAIGAIVLTPGPVARAADHGIDGETVYADSFTTRVSGDVQSIDLNAKPLFLDTPAKQAGFAAILAVLVGSVVYAWQHIAFGFAALYTRLNKPDILDNDVRNNIYDIIRTTPGISAREVHRRSSQSWGTVVYHLRQLERHHLVVSRSLGRTRNYYENHGKYRGMEVQLACLQSDRARVLARAIAGTPGITQEQLAAASGYPQPTTSYYVRKLKQAGLVEEQRDGRYVKYVPHADLPRFIAMSEKTPTTGPADAGVQA